MRRKLGLALLFLASCSASPALTPVPAVPPPSQAPSAARIAAALPRLTATTLVEDARAAGLDPKALPALTALGPVQLKALMPSFSKALGMTCSDCHAPHDFAAPTPMKAIAEGMWNHFARQLAFADGAPVYCDSCHQGRRKLLNRADPIALNFAMDAEYAGRLRQKSARPGARSDCSTCHGDPFEPRILANLWRVVPPAGHREKTP